MDFSLDEGNTMADHVATETEPQAPTRPVAAGIAPNAQLQSLPANQAVAAVRSDKPITGQILPPKRKSKRRVLLPILLLGAIGGGGYFANEYLTNWQFLVSTD